MAVTFGCPLVGTIGELETRVLKIGQRAYATNATYEDLHPEQEDGKIVSLTPWKTGDGSTAFKDLPWDKNMSGDDDANFKTAFRYIKTYDTIEEFETLPKPTIKTGDTFIIKKGGSTSKIYDFSNQEVFSNFYIGTDKNIYFTIDDKNIKTETLLPGSIINFISMPNNEIILTSLESFKEQTVDGSQGEDLIGWLFENRLGTIDVEVTSLVALLQSYTPPQITCGDGDMLSWIGEEIGWKNLCGENESGAETIENKSTIIDDNADDTKYPTTKAVKTFVESKIGSGGNVNLDNYYTKKETDSKITTASNNAIATANNLANNSIDIALSKYYTKKETDAKISSVYKYCGSVDDLGKLPTVRTNISVGDTYNIVNAGNQSSWNSIIFVNWKVKFVENNNRIYIRIEENGIDITEIIPERTVNILSVIDLNTLVEGVGWETEEPISNSGLELDIDKYQMTKDIKCNDGDNLSWTGFTWDNLGGTVDLSNYYTNEEVNTRLNEKQNIDNMLHFVNNDLFDLDDVYPSVGAVVDYVKREISSLYKYRGSVNDLNSLPNLTIGGDIGYTYNVINSSSRGFTYEKSLGGIFIDSLLIITDGEGNNISSLFPRGSIITCGNGDILSLETLTDNKWRTNPSYENRSIHILQYSQPTITCDSGDNVVWTGYSWDILSGTVDLSNYYTKQEVDDELQNKEDKSNKITFEEWNSSDNKVDLLFNDDKYISSLLALALHEEINFRLNNEVERFENKKCVEGEFIANAPYYSVEATQKYVKDYVDNQLGSIEEAVAAIIALQNSYIGGETV